VSGVETITCDGTVLAHIVRSGPLPSKTSFLTPDDCNLQVGRIVYPAGGEIARHMHLPIERHVVGTTEVLIVERGRCVVDVYAEDRRVVATRDLAAGDMLIAVGGGHGFRVVEDLVLLEIKQGPYLGDATTKERF
jgi:mannose-6-phosphate isomerase-like protein (cupin superfamily)